MSECTHEQQNFFLSLCTATHSFLIFSHFFAAKQTNQVLVRIVFRSSPAQRTLPHSVGFQDEPAVRSRALFAVLAGGATRDCRIICHCSPAVCGPASARFVSPA